MITESLFYALIDVPYKILSAVPLFDKTLNYSLDVNIVKTFCEYLGMVGYFLPLGTILVLLGILVSQELLKIGLSLLKLIWHFVPIFGN